MAGARENDKTIWTIQAGKKRGESFSLHICGDMILAIPIANKDTELLVSFLVYPDALELAQLRAIIKGIPNICPAIQIFAKIPILLSHGKAAAAMDRSQQNTPIIGIIIKKNNNI